MKRFLVLFLLSAFVLAEAFPAEEPLANAGRKGLQAKTIDEMLALPDEEIDIGLGALLIGKEYDPDLDVRKYLAKLDQMAREARDRLRFCVTVGSVVAELNRYLFVLRGFRAADPESKSMFLHTLLSTRTGECASLSALYLAIGERIGLPLYGVPVPGHTFVRYVYGGYVLNIETTADGGWLPDTAYAVEFRLPPTPEGRSFYLRSLSKRRFLGLLLSNLGASVVEAGRAVGAWRVCESAVVVNPQLAEAWCNLGLAYSHLGRLADALGAYKTALRINPGDAEAWNNLGTAYEDMGNLNAARQAYRNAVTIKPEEAVAWANLALTLAENGSQRDTAYAYWRAASLNPDLASHWGALVALRRQRRELQGVLDACRRAVERAPEDNEKWRDLGWAYWVSGRVLESKRAFLRSVGINSGDSGAWLGLGLCYASEGKLHHTAAACRRAAEADASCAEAWTVYGQAYAEMEDFERAAAGYRAALSVNPDLVSAWTGLGAVFLLTSKHGDAIKAFQRALGIDETDPDAWLGMGFARLSRGTGRVFSTIAQRDFDRAIEAFNRGLQLAPDDGRFHYGLALSYYSKGDAISARSHLQRCEQLGLEIQPELANLLGYEDGSVPR